MKTYKRHRFPPEIISYAVWLYFRFNLSHRDVEDLLAERGIIVSYETIRLWCIKFGPKYARRLRRSHSGFGDTFYLDEVFVKMSGKQHYLWRAVDQDGQAIDVLVQRKRDKEAAKHFFRKLRKKAPTPRLIVTDKIRSYIKPCKLLFNSTTHRSDKGSNNRAENSHQPTRLRETKMRCFKSKHQAQRFVSNFSTIYDYFRYDQHKLTASNHRLLRERSFELWKRVALSPSAAM